MSCPMLGQVHPDCPSNLLMPYQIVCIILNSFKSIKIVRCCVCLGDFEIKEQLHQIPSCKHMFHLECIHHWLMSNTTCPLCRTSILPTKMEPPIRLNMVRPSDAESSDIQQQGPQDQVMVIVVENINEERSSSIEGSIGCPCSTESGNSQARDTPIDASVGVQIQIHEG